MLAHLLGNEEEIVDDMLRPAFELGPQVFALGRYTRGTRVEVALPRHVAAERDQQAGAEPELLSAEQRGDHDVAAVAQPAVGAQAHALAQPIRDQHLLGLGQAELPRSARVLDRRERRRPGAAVVAGDEDVVGPGLGDSGGDGADARLRHELDADSRTRVHGLQVMDELREILDRVDVVMRRRRDELHARLRVAQARNQAGDLEPGQLSALAGLGALRDLDLQLVGALQVARGHAEPR